jgi:NAD(P)-dependent dehydrogenase (short-subunit alcohol dehydrogenase family)
MKLLEDKVALITGGTSGIGLTSALACAREGAKVVICGRSETKGADAVKFLKENGHDVMYVKCDVSVASEVESLINKVVSTYGRLDCAFNNAGIAGVLDETANTTEEDWDISMVINLKSVWLCMKYELIQMLKQGKGSIVNTASAAGLVALPGASAYSVAKWGVVGLSKTAAAEYVTKGIRVNALCPAFVATPLTGALAQAYPEFVQKIFPFQIIGRMGETKEIAEPVVWLLSDAASFITGASISVDGGYTAM